MGPYRKFRFEGLSKGRCHRLPLLGALVLVAVLLGSGCAEPGAQGGFLARLQLVVEWPAHGTVLAHPGSGTGVQATMAALSARVTLEAAGFSTAGT